MSPYRSFTAALQDSNSGVRVLVYLGGILISVMVTAFAAGGIWWQVSTSMGQQEVILSEIKAMRRDMDMTDGLMSLFRFQLQERADAADRDRKEIFRRLERLEEGRRFRNGGV